MLRAVALSVPLLLLAACLGGGARRLSGSDPVELTRMMTDLQQARVIFVGEFHDQRDHHKLQLEIIKGLQEQGTPLAIGLEMFDLEQQPVLDEWVTGKLSLKEFVARYQKGWSINWAEYDAIMLFARNNKIPMIALDAPADLVRSVTHGGGAALTHDALKRLPAGVSTSILPSYRKFMSQAFSSHQMPAPLFENFCAAQGLRNSTMARLILGYLERNPAQTMVVIAGVGHTIRRAAPHEVIREGKRVRIVLPSVEGLEPDIASDDADYIVESE